MDHGRKIYFAYGSNMSVRRLQKRVPSTNPLGAGRLAGHELTFRKKSRDGSAKCDIALSDGRDVWGVLFEIDVRGEEALDGFEGLGMGYRKELVQVLDSVGRDTRAFTYLADSAYIDGTLRPYTWYLQHVLVGAEDAGLPASYVAGIKRVEAWHDPDGERESKELAIYGNDSILTVVADNEAC